MESPRMRYAKGHGHGFSSSSSSSKRPFSSSNKHLRSVKLSKKLSKISRRFEVANKSKRRLPSQDLPLHLKRPFKMSTTASSPKTPPPKPSTSKATSSPGTSSPNPSSPKRPHPEDGTNDHPSKKAKVAAKQPLLLLEDIMQLGGSPTTLPAKVTKDNGDVEEREDAKAYLQVLRRKKILSKSVQGSRLEFPLPAQKGMKNPGVLCYRNSLLQSLLHQPKFVNWILLNHLPENCVFEEALCVACGVRNLAISQINSGDLVPELDRNHRLFKSLGWNAGPSGQGDPDEHLGWIMNQLSYQMPKPLYHHLESVFNTITDNSINCSCGHSSLTKNQTLGTISVDLQPRAPRGALSTYLDQCFNGVVEGYKCEKCGDSRKDKSKTSRITHFPDVLVLALKRFDYALNKDSVTVRFGETLNLDRLAADCNTQNANYELSAVVAHCGNVNYGHYVAAVKCEDEKWRMFNDERVSVVSVQEALGGRRDFTPYLLFWQRVEEVIES